MHKVLSKIHGPPSYASLKNLSTEIKANASSVPTTLGGGRYGHLGLILSPAAYATLDGSAPWVTPPHAGSFMPPGPPATAAQIEAARDVWRERTATYEIFQATEKAIIAQIVAAIDVEYLRSLQNEDSGLFTDDLNVVLDHLFAEHGTVTPQALDAKRLSILQTHYSIMQPVDNVFTSVEDLCKLAAHAGSPISLSQKLDLAYILFSKEPLLQLDLRTWSRRPLAERTWANMITHFRLAHKELRSFPTAGDIYHQQPAYANSAVNIADLVTQRLLEAAAAEVLPTEAPPYPVPDQANAATTLRETNLVARETALLTQMQEMMAAMRNPNPRGGRGNRGRTNNRNTSATPGRGRAPAPRHYCWTHGACAHAGAQCLNPVTGHQTTATFANMQGGSSLNCFWLPA